MFETKRKKSAEDNPPIPKNGNGIPLKGEIKEVLDPWHKGQKTKVYVVNMDGYYTPGEIWRTCARKKGYKKHKQTKWEFNDYARLERKFESLKKHSMKSGEWRIVKHQDNTCTLEKDNYDSFSSMSYKKIRFTILPKRVYMYKNLPQPEILDITDTPDTEQISDNQSQEFDPDSFIPESDEESDYPTETDDCPKPPEFDFLDNVQ